MKISLSFFFFAALVLLVSLGFLFKKTRQLVWAEATAEAAQLLNNTTEQVDQYLDEVETATTTLNSILQDNLQPDFLLHFVRKVVEVNPSINGCSITMEPDFFPQEGRLFSVYAVRQGDSVVAVREDEYNYYEMVWYKSAKKAGRAVWVDPYDDSNGGSLFAKDLIASYSMPIIRASDSVFIGVISTDFSLPKLSKTISAQKPYPHSFCMMLGRDGNFFVHPDSTKLVTSTIFTDVDPMEHADIITLGHEMLSGGEGMLHVVLDDEPCEVFYRPLSNTFWSIALVCSESDIFELHHRLVYVVLAIALLGVLLLLLLCWKSISHFIAPISQLSVYTKSIADGHFDEQMSVSDRNDEVGTLQNSFVAMQQALDRHISHLQQMNEETARKNQELAEASQAAIEANRRKTDFVQDMSHQIRTPLNIIQGFAQVLTDDYQIISAEEAQSITATMQQNARHMSRMVAKLTAAATMDSSRTLARKNSILVLGFAQELMLEIEKRNQQQAELVLDADGFPPELRLRTNRDTLFKILTELLTNAIRFAPGGPIILRLTATPLEIIFTVEDHGPGIASSDRSLIFSHFTKLDSFTEGLGLGLPISQQFAILLGGSLNLDETYHEGARFILKIPNNKKRHV